MVIDADSHVIESEQTWSHLDPAYHARRPIACAVPGDTSFKGWNSFWVIDRKVRHFGATPIAGNLVASRKTYAPGCQQLTDVPDRVAAMDRMQVSRQVVHPSFMLSILTEDPELETALIQSYNSFMMQACGQAPGRLYFNAVLPWRSPDAAVAELDRVAGHPAVASVLIRGMEWNRPMDHPHHYPVFQAIQKTGLPMAVHLGIGSPSMHAMFDGMVHPKAEMKTFYPPYSRRLLSTLTVQYGFYNLLEGSLIDDFPGLKWVFLEGGGSTWMVGALRTIERSGKPDAARYFREGRIFVGCEPDDDLPFVAEALGEDALLVSSDMPHFDEAAHDHIAEEYEQRGDLSASMLSKMFEANPGRAFRFGGSSGSSGSKA